MPDAELVSQNELEAALVAAATSSEARRRF
jgi:hypothetical protein